MSKIASILIILIIEIISELAIFIVRSFVVSRVVHQAPYEHRGFITYIQDGVVLVKEQCKIIQ
jgi:hypothetical protein